MEAFAGSGGLSFSRRLGNKKKCRSFSSYAMVTHDMFKVSRESFSEAIPIFFNRLKSVFFPCQILL